MVAKCFYLSRNLFPSFGYGRLKYVFAVIWPYKWYMRHIWCCVSEYQTPLRGLKKKKWIQIGQVEDERYKGNEIWIYIKQKMKGLVKKINVPN